MRSSYSLEEGAEATFEGIDTDVAIDRPAAISEAMIACVMSTSRIATASVPRRVRRVWANVFSERSAAAFQNSRLNSIISLILLVVYSTTIRKIFWREVRLREAVAI